MTLPLPIVVFSAVREREPMRFISIFIGGCRLHRQGFTKTTCTITDNSDTGIVVLGFTFRSFGTWGKPIFDFVARSTIVGFRWVLGSSKSVSLGLGKGHKDIDLRTCEVVSGVNEAEVLQDQLLLLLHHLKDNCHDPLSYIGATLPVGAVWGGDVLLCWTCHG
eukprot:2024324-Amphidinium_carterae.1